MAVYVTVAYVFLPALWSRFEHWPRLAALPMVSRTAQGIPGDPMNVGLVGSRDEAVRAMTKAGWHPADPITLKTSIAIGVDVVLRRPYADAPVSSLFYQGRRQDMAFELPVSRSPAKRHHVRFWQALERGAEGREVWLGSATFDRGVGLSHDTGQITHHIDGDLDAERAFCIHSLVDARILSSVYLIRGIGPTLRGRNGGGDLYFTDGDVTVGEITADADVANSTPGAPPPAPPATPIRDRVWAAVVATGRFLRLLPQPHHDGG